MAIQVISPNSFLAKYINLFYFNLFLDSGIPFYIHAARKFLIPSQLPSTTSDISHMRWHSWDYVTKSSNVS